jgi:3-methyladenine DNA glycosylase AlkD
MESAVAYVSRELASRACPSSAKAMQKYMKTDMPFLGVKSAGQKEVFRGLKKEYRPSTPDEYAALVAGLWSLPHREEKYVAISAACGFREFIVPQSLAIYSRLIREGAWWDLVDGVAIHCVGVLVRGYRRELRPIMESWIDDGCMWIRRSALLCQIGHRADTDEQMLFEFCRRRASETEFFIRKAIGWALRDYSYAAPDSVARFLGDNSRVLSGLSRREGARVLVRRGLPPSV